MDFFFCIPLIFGCATKVSPEGDQTPRICPRCHNAAVTSAKSREFFEFCFVPLIPISTKHIWVCAICQWSLPVHNGGWEPQAVSMNMPTLHTGYYPPQPQPAAFQGSYNPQYIQPSGAGMQGPYTKP